MITPKEKGDKELTILYFHGRSFSPKRKIMSLIEAANKLKARIVVFNYRGYCYSEKLSKVINEKSI